MICVQIRSATRIQCDLIRQFRHDSFCCASRARQEPTIRPKISQNDFDLTELENFEVWSGRPEPEVDLHTGRDPLHAEELVEGRRGGAEALGGRARRRVEVARVARHADVAPPAPGATSPKGVTGGWALERATRDSYARWPRPRRPRSSGPMVWSAERVRLAGRVRRGAPPARPRVAERA